jgi:predicted HicB family RNase H-like nuclease
MKKTDLYKNLGLKIDGQMKNARTPDRFGQAGAPDRKEQRKLDQQRGLIPFAVKIESSLAAEVRAAAQARGVDLNELVGELLRKGLSA